MCIICKNNTEEYKKIERLICCPNVTAIPNIKGLKSLHCRYCPYITSIPHIKGLKRLLCDNCPSLKTIPNIEDLIILMCDNCAKLKSIPPLKKVQLLFCYNCPSLKSIPELPDICTLECDTIHWLFHNRNPLCTVNMNYLIKLQRFTKKWLKLKRLIEWLESQDFNKWYYSPNNPGAIRAIQRITRNNSLLLE